MTNIKLINEYHKQIKAVKKGIAKYFKKVDESNYKEKLEDLGYEPAHYTFESGKDIDETFEELNKKVGIYVFTENTQILSEDKWNTFKENCPKKEGKDKKMYKRKFPAWNKNINNAGSKIFYLGKSENLKKRLLEHTGDPSASTYALKLSLFDEIFDYSIDVFYSDDKSDDSSLDFELVNSIVESTLHNKLTPKIGTSRK